MRMRVCLCEHACTSTCFLCEFVCVFLVYGRFVCVWYIHIYVLVCMFMYVYVYIIYNYVGMHVRICVYSYAGMHMLAHKLSW